MWLAGWLVSTGSAVYPFIGHVTTRPTLPLLTAASSSSCGGAHASRLFHHTPRAPFTLGPNEDAARDRAHAERRHTLHQQIAIRKTKGHNLYMYMCTMR